MADDAAEEDLSHDESCLSSELGQAWAHQPTIEHVEIV